MPATELPHGYLNGRPVLLIGKPILRRGTSARRHHYEQCFRYLDGAREGGAMPAGKLNKALAASDRRAP